MLRDSKAKSQTGREYLPAIQTCYRTCSIRHKELSKGNHKKMTQMKKRARGLNRHFITEEI